MKRFAIAVLLICAAQNGFAIEERFLSVEFKGFSLVSSRAFALRAGMRTENGTVSADRARITAELKNEAIFTDYKLIDKNRRLRIVVEERKILFSAVIIGNFRSVCGVIDKDFRFLSSSSVRSNMPILILTVKDVQGGAVTESVKEFIRDAVSVSGKIGFKEIESIALREDNRVELVFRKRQTVVTCSADKSGILSALAAIGWCDKNETQPKSLYVGEEYTTVKEGLR